MFAIVALAACGSQGTQTTPRGPDCIVEVLPVPPGSDYVQIGELSLDAYAAGPASHQYKNPHALAAELRPQICAIGGDTFVTERNAAGVIVRGTVFRRMTMLDLPPPSPPARLPSRAEICEPSCDPGSTCEGGTCIPQCVPACGDGETCSSDRRCQPNP